MRHIAEVLTEVQTREKTRHKNTKKPPEIGRLLLCLNEDLRLPDGGGDNPVNAALVIGIMKNKSLTTDRVQIMIGRVDKRKTERESR